MIAAMRSALLALITLPLLACSSSFGKGIAHYDRAEYPQALEELAAAEGELPTYSHRERARYALYRGLTHFALGNRELALPWLEEAKRAYEADPSLLSDEEAGKLGSAWAHLPTE